MEGDLQPLGGRLAVVTGASSGIGRAIAVRLSREGARVCAIGRNLIRLAETVEAARQFSQATSFQIDLVVEENLQPLLRHLEEAGRLDILIHSAGIVHQDPMERSRIEDFDLQYSANVRAPYLLTQRLLPLLTAAPGQIVFINSSAGLAAKRPEIGQYAATKHALRAMADSLREELNPKGVRVLSVYLGRTATPMQEALCRKEGKDYHPELFLQPGDVATMVAHTLCLPRTAEVTDISMRPMHKLY
ncbi:MAG TPA: SDR family oxidoreductase [Blastocatellia bacterium]|nr:SDR family oxidoreductase [Blastocatellia bacterium]